ncbi:hypothetical protein TNCV_2163391 [Trichonephila clavipes]|nr:hypothetical protein TNCV_2163391 [Trichonephila clavipes]
MRKSGQPIRRLRKTCKNAFPRKIPVSFGRLDTPIATESSLNVHFFNFHVNCNSRVSSHALREDPVLHHEQEQPGKSTKNLFQSDI